MLPLFSRVVLTSEVPSGALVLRQGDVGAIVEVYENGAFYAVEFFSVNGDTLAVETVRADQLRPITDRDMMQARALA